MKPSRSLTYQKISTERILVICAIILTQKSEKCALLVTGPLSVEFLKQINISGCAGAQTYCSIKPERRRNYHGKQREEVGSLRKPGGGDLRCYPGDAHRLGLLSLHDT